MRTQARHSVDLIRQSGGEATFVRCDVSRGAEVEAMVEQAISHYGRLDIAYNNAGVECEMATIGEATESDWDRVLSINLKGIWLCLKHEITGHGGPGPGNHRELFVTGGAAGTEKHGLLRCQQARRRGADQGCGP